MTTKLEKRERGKAAAGFAITSNRARVREKTAAAHHSTLTMHTIIFFCFLCSYIVHVFKFELATVVLVENIDQVC